MTLPKVSVIIPVWNTEKYLEKCLDSVINQTYKNLEIICINDGSTDKSSEILDSYAKNDNRIIVINQENSGVSRARNKGLDIATGEYVAFVDSDDWIEQNCYDEVISFIAQHNDVELLSYGVNIVNERDLTDKDLKVHQNWYDYPKTFSGKKVVNPKITSRITGTLWRLIFKKDIIDNLNLRFMDYKMCEDILFIYSYLSSVETIYFIDEKLYNYRLRIGSAMDKHGWKNNPFYWIESCRNILLACQEFYEQNNKLEKFFQMRIYKRFINMILYSVKNLKEQDKSECIEYLKTLANSLKDDRYYGKEIEFIRNNKFYKFKGLSSVKFGNKLFGIMVFKNDYPAIVLNLLGISLPLLYLPKVDISQKLKHFVSKNNEYLARQDKSVKSRLFLTTGNLSLLNNLAIIKQLNEQNCEDTLFIFSNIKNPKFFDTCKQMASLHNFKDIKCLRSRHIDFLNYFMKNKMTDFDEIFFSNQYQFINVVNNLYPNAKWILTDEGAVGKIARNEYFDYDKVEKIIGHNYLDKIDFFGLNDKNYAKIVKLDKEIFKSIAQKCSKKSILDVDFTDKNVLFCGSWWEGSGMSKAEYFQLQNSVIEKLLSLGYKVIFKPHPRDPREYIDNLDIQILQANLPLECYDLDVVAVVSLSSLSTINSLYFNELPSFSVSLLKYLNADDKPLEKKWLDILVKKLTDEYTAPIDILYSVDAQDYSKNELKNILMEKCTDYIKNKPVLSENKEFEDFAREKGYFE